MLNKYDVIIIGSGIAGLICGTKLAKNGLKVLMLEKHYKPGGCVTSCKKNGFNFDYGAHIFGSCNKTGIFNYYLKELKVDNIDFIRINPTDRFIFPDQVIEVPQNLDEYISILSDKYPKEAKKIAPFFSEVIKIARSFSSKNLLSKYKGLTFEKLLKAYFKNYKLMSILSAQFRYLGCSPQDLAATSMCLMMVSYLRDGTYYPRGGTQNIPDAVAKKFKEYGGTILFKNEVSKIIIKNQKIYGIMTKDGECYQSDMVISNSDATRTFFNLIGSDAMIDRAYLKKIKKLKTGASFFTTFLGVKNSLDLRNKSGWYHFSYGLNISLKQSLYIFIPSFVDSLLAPKNKHVVELAIPFPYKFDEIKDWKSCKEELKSCLLSMAEKIIPGLQKAIEFEESATPKTVERYTYNSNGSACGWDMDVNQVGDYRLSYDTPVEGLYLTGHWTNPGCGVAPAATSGWIVAEKAMKGLTVKESVTLLR